MDKMDRMDNKKGQWGWLPDLMPGVARLMRDRRRMHGNAHLDECWRRGVQQRQPGWFFAREGALAVGTPWDDPGLTNFAAAQITSGQALLMTRVPEAGDAG